MRNRGKREISVKRGRRGKREKEGKRHEIKRKMTF